jgi:hypothetical protein
MGCSDSSILRGRLITFAYWLTNNKPGKIHNEATLHMMAIILTVMTIGQAIRLSQHSNFIVLVGRGEHKIFGYITLVSAVMFIIIAVICLKVYNFGLIAMAWSNCIPIIVFSGILLQIYFNRKLA